MCAGRVINVRMAHPTTSWIPIAVNITAEIPVLGRGLGQRRGCLADSGAPICRAGREIDAVDPSQLLQILCSRRDAIADRWYQAIARVSYIPLEGAEVRQRLAELTEQIIAILDAEPFERDKAQAIGVALARLTHAQPEALGRTQEVLARHLLEAVTTEQAVALRPSLVALLGAMATGFLQQARDTILTEQERIRCALVSEMRETEQALRESEARYRTLFENAPIGMGVFDAGGNVLAFNDALLAPLGYARGDVASIESIADMCYDPDERDRVLAVIDKRGFLHQREMRVKRKDGAYCHMLLGLVPITWKGEHCWQVMALDITARKQAERQASRAERMAAMGRLATALAHEINNPLQAMRTNLELVLDFDLEPDEQVGYLDVARQEIDRLSKITRRVLDFTQPADETRHPV